MPITNGKLTAREAAAIRYYTDPTSNTRNKWGESYIKAGYSECSGWANNASKVYKKDRVQAGIKAEIERMTDKSDWSVDRAKQMLLETRERAITQGTSSVEVSAVIAINRMYGLDKDASLDKQEAEALTPDELETLRKQAVELTKPTIKLNTA